jgi:hypothetical protein
MSERKRIIQARLTDGYRNREIRRTALRRYVMERIRDLHAVTQ